MRIADHVEAHGAGVNLISVPGLICELDPIIGEYGVDPVWHRFEEMFEELPRGFSISFVDQLGHRELAGSRNANKEIQLSFRGLHLGDIDVEEADRVALELLPFGLIAADIIKPGNTMTLQTAVKSIPAEMRDAGLECVKAIVQGKQSVAPECDDNSLFSCAQDCRTGLFRPRLLVFNRRPLLPLSDRLWVDPEFPPQLRERSLRSARIAARTACVVVALP